MMKIKLKNKKYLNKTGIIYIIMVFVFLASNLNTIPASAADLSKFQAGNIISDSIFTAKNSMSASQIQSFLNVKVPTCDTNGQQLSEYGGPDLNGDGKVQRWEWGKQYYNQTMFTCLKNYSEGGKSAAQIIYDTAQTYSINPKVLAVVLQKEQALVTDTWPLDRQYRSATGYGCPDTAACDSQYYGFTNQVKWSATMFRSIMNNSPSWYTPYELGNNRIPWHPNTASCGYSTVNIINRATQALYNYTPYRPNQAALNSGYGSGDSCSSYGNRNFYAYFTDWFGTTIGSPTYNYSLVSTEYFSDNTLTTTVNKDSIERNSSAYVRLKIKNTGNQVWYKEFLRLGTAKPQDRQSDLYNSSWMAPNRVGPPLEDSVAANETATFVFKIDTQYNLGNYTESFSALLEGQRWLPGSIDLNYTLTSSVTFRNIELSAVRAYRDTLKTKPVNIDDIRAYVGEKLLVEIDIKNTGNTTLPAGTSKIGTSNPNDRASVFASADWLTSGRPASLSNPLDPGNSTTISFTLDTPNTTTGKVYEYFGFLVENVSWIKNDLFRVGLSLSVKPPASISGVKVLQKGDRLMSGKESYVLAFQGDGNLVLYDKNKKPLWDTRTYDKNADKLILQSDGNLVLYDKNKKPLWDTRTYDNGESRLSLQNDGNLVLYRLSAGSTWATYTH